MTNMLMVVEVNLLLCRAVRLRIYSLKAGALEWDADEEKEEEVAVACEAVRAEKPMDALWSCLMELMYVDVWCISVPVYEYRQHLSWAICMMI
jgi:hypothetical protein